MAEKAGSASDGNNDIGALKPQEGSGRRSRLGVGISAENPEGRSRSAASPIQNKEGRMRRVILVSAILGFAATLFVASSALADYCRTDACPVGSANATHTQCCMNPGGVPSDTSHVCGEIALGAVNVVGGCAAKYSSTALRAPGNELNP